MGLVASQARLIFLTAYRSDIEFQVQMICQRRMDLAMRSSGVAVGQAANASNYSQSYQAIMNNSGLSDDQKQQQLATLDAQQKAKEAGMESQLSVLHNQDKVLEMTQKQLETQRDAAVTEIESVKKVIDKNIEMSFKYFA